MNSFINNAGPNSYSNYYLGGTGSYWPIYTSNTNNLTLGNVADSVIID